MPRDAVSLRSHNDVGVTRADVPRVLDPALLLAGTEVSLHVLSDETGVEADELDRLCLCLWSRQTQRRCGSALTLDVLDGAVHERLLVSRTEQIADAVFVAAVELLRAVVAAETRPASIGNVAPTRRLAISVERVDGEVRDGTGIGRRASCVGRGRRASVDV